MQYSGAAKTKKPNISEKLPVTPLRMAGVDVGRVAARASIAHLEGGGGVEIWPRGEHELGVAARAQQLRRAAEHVVERLDVIGDGGGF